MKKTVEIEAKEFLREASIIQDGPVKDPDKISCDSENTGARLTLNHFILRATRPIQPMQRWADVTKKAQDIVCGQMEWANMFDPSSRMMTTDQIRGILAQCAQ